jgi:hypothetical protein
VSETKRQEEVEQQDAQQSLHTWVGKAEPRSTGTVHHDGTFQLMKRVFADGAVVADSLDVERRSVGVKANGCSSFGTEPVLLDPSEFRPG